MNDSVTLPDAIMSTPPPRRRIRIQGNRVLLLPMPDVQTSAGGIVAPNTYGKQNNYFWVLATGPGRYVKIGKNRVWISPECQRGDKVISRHWAREAPAGWHKTEHVEKEDQRSGVLVDARFIECVIGAEEKQI